MRVLRHARRLARPGGLFLDLTSIPPAAAIEHDGAVLGRLDQGAFLARAAVTEAAVDRFVGDGLLVEEARCEVDVLKHFDTGGDMLEDTAGRAYSHVPPELTPTVGAIMDPVVERSHCLLRRLRVL